MAACTYREELLGLLEIHLISLAVNKVHMELSGRAAIYSDCLVTINMVATPHPTRIPSRCKHSDILKTIMINCRNLSFSRSDSHVTTHPDDNMDYQQLSRPVQLNYMFDIGAKNFIWGVRRFQS